MTVEELIGILQTLPVKAEVRIAYDSGCAYDDAKSVSAPDAPDHKYIYISTIVEDDAIILQG